MLEVDARHKRFSKIRFQYFGTPKSGGFSARRPKQPAENGKESPGIPSTLNRLHIDTISPYGYSGESIRNFQTRLSVCNQRCNQNVIKIDYIFDYSHAIPGREFHHRKCVWFSLVHIHTPTLCYTALTNIVGHHLRAALNPRIPPILLWGLSVCQNCGIEKFRKTFKDHWYYVRNRQEINFRSVWDDSRATDSLTQLV